MKNQSFDMNFAPKSYFEDLTLEEKLESKIKGQIRSEFVQNNIRIKPINPKVFQSELDQDMKSAQSSVHPWMMGGEYLPDLYENETEICRIVLRSTTMDVTSMRVQLIDNKLIYRIVDEYEEYNLEFKLPISSSTAPLTMGQIIENINNCDKVDTATGETNHFGGEGLVRPWVYQQFESGDALEEAVSFVTVHSAFYSELEKYYEDQKTLWYREMCQDL